MLSCKVRLCATRYVCRVPHSELAAENDWQLPQQIAPVEELLTGQKQSYGFLNLHSGFFTHVAHAENDVNVLGLDIETLPASERSGKLRESEEKKWDEEYYMCASSRSPFAARPDEQHQDGLHTGRRDPKHHRVGVSVQGRRV